MNVSCRYKWFLLASLPIINRRSSLRGALKVAQGLAQRNLGDAAQS
jgi:hypothetical protein